MKIKRENADMIIALASDQSLIKICRRMHSGSALWRMPNEDTYFFDSSCVYRLTTKENVDAAIHYLNGGTIQEYREGYPESWLAVSNWDKVDFTEGKFRLKRKQKQIYIKYKNNLTRAALDFENNIAFFRNETPLTSMSSFLDAFLNDELQVKKD